VTAAFPLSWAGHGRPPDRTTPCRCRIGRVGDRGYFIEPTVLTNARPDMRVVREEIFAPVVVAAPSVTWTRSPPKPTTANYGPGAGIWTRDISKAHAPAKKLQAGTVWSKCCAATAFGFPASAVTGPGGDLLRPCPSHTGPSRPHFLRNVSPNWDKSPVIAHDA
jgi:hypothetical protein